MSKITGYAALATLADPDLLLVVDVNDTSMAASGTDKKLLASALKSYVLGIVASGDTTGVTDTANIKAALLTTAGAVLGPGTFYYNATLTITANSRLTGQGWGATVLTATAGFTFDGSGAMINVTGAHAEVGSFQHVGGPNSGSISSYSSNPAGNGIQLQPGAQYCNIHDLGIYSQNGYELEYVGGAGSTNIIGTMIRDLQRFQNKQGIHLKGSAGSSWNGQVQIVAIQAGQLSGDSLFLEDIQDISVLGYNDSVVGATGVPLHIKGNCSAIRIANPDLGQFPNTGANLPTQPGTLIEDSANGSPNDVTILPGVIQQGVVGIRITGGATRIHCYARIVQNQQHGIDMQGTGFDVAFYDGSLSANGQAMFTGAYTATNASPCVFTATGSTFAAGQPVTLSGGSPPTGFSNGTTYYVVNPSGATFQLAATLGGAAINSSSTGNGTATAVDYEVSWTGSGSGKIKRCHMATAIGTSTGNVTNVATFAGAGQVEFDDNELAGTGVTTSNAFATTPKFSRRNKGYNPTGSVNITVPASGSPTAGRSFDMWQDWTAAAAAGCALTGFGNPTRTASTFTTNGTTTITDTGNSFTQADIGRHITGTNIPANTLITAVASAGSATMSNAASGSGSTLTETIEGWGIPAGGNKQILVPAGQTVTPVYATAPVLSSAGL